MDGAGLCQLFARLGPLAQAPAAATTLRDAAQLLAVGGRALLDADLCRVAVLTPDRAGWRTLQESGGPASGSRPAVLPDDAEPLCEAIRRQQPLFLETHRPDAHDGPGAEVALPLTGSMVGGAISFGFAAPRRFGPDERLLLTLAAQVATLALERAQATERARALERDAGQRAEASETQAALHQIIGQEEERRRFSRELHDGTGQYLTVLALKLRALRDSLAPGAEAQDALRQMEILVEGMGREIHHLAVRLRPTALDDQGLSEALQNYLDEWTEHTGIPVDLHSTGLDETRLPVAHGTIIYRVVQEALNNIFKHAGAAHVSLILEQDDRSVRAIIEDDGRGFDADASPSPLPQDRRLGLVGMNERAAAVGGQCTVESSPGGGTTVFLRLPLAPHDPAHAAKG